jgi:uncharacterized Zn-binding protein involved in type VI secretion
MAAQGRLGDKARAFSDAHGCPACPHVVAGPGISGSPNVFVNNRPALRVSDRGMHGACCAGNTWVAQAGSATVFINGKPAHRVGDVTVHCGDRGELIEGSANVNVGDGGSAGGPAPAPTGIEMPPMATPGVPITLKLGALRLPPFVTRVIAPVTWIIDGQEHSEHGHTATVTLSGEHSGRQVTVLARLGGGPAVKTTVKVPRLTIEGPSTVEIDDKIELRARVAPHVAGSYVWFDVRGRKLGEGPTLTFVGKEKSKKEGDQPAECRFTPRGGSDQRATHPITVEKLPWLKLPIHISLGDLGATARWLGDNPVEVRIDDAVAPSHAMAEDAGRIVVSFRAQPGEHTVVVSSGSPHFAAGQAPIRIVHFSCKVKVTAAD